MNPTKKQTKLMEDINQEYLNVSYSFNRLAEYFVTLSNSTKNPEFDDANTPQKSKNKETEPTNKSNTKLKKRPRDSSKDDILQSKLISIVRSEEICTKKAIFAQLIPIDILSNGKKELGYSIQTSFGKYTDIIGPFENFKFASLLKNSLQQEMEKVSIKTRNIDKEVHMLMQKVKEQMYSKFPPMKVYNNDITAKKKEEHESDEDYVDINQENINGNVYMNYIDSKNYNAALILKNRLISK